MRKLGYGLMAGIVAIAMGGAAQAYDHHTHPTHTTHHEMLYGRHNHHYHHFYKHDHHHATATGGPAGGIPHRN